MKIYIYRMDYSGTHGRYQHPTPSLDIFITDVPEQIMTQNPRYWRRNNITIYMNGQKKSMNIPYGFENVYNNTVVLDHRDDDLARELFEKDKHKEIAELKEKIQKLETRIGERNNEWNKK